MKLRVAARLNDARSLKGLTALALVLGVAVTPVAMFLDSSPAAAQPSTTYAPGTPTLASLTSPTSCTADSTATCAPWNEYQGDSSAPSYASQAPGTVLPLYTPGGATTTTDNGPSGAVTEPNLAVVPNANSGTDGVAAYPSGVVGTPGPLDDYCGSGPQTTESAGSVSRQTPGTTLPLAPAYFPHIVRNADGSLTGYFDYRPKDADEALVAATSTDNGQQWTYDGEALEQNQGYCPSSDINDDGQGHANLIEVNGQWYLYTLARAAGDMQGVGMIVHPFSPSEASPLNGLPSSDPVGIDPDAFVTASSLIPVPTTGTGASIPLTTTGTANSPEQLISGGFIDLTQDPTPTPADQLNCTVTLNNNTLTSCTAPDAGSGLTVYPSDLIEQILGWTTPSSDVGLTIPAGPNTTNGDGGLASFTIDNSAAGGTPGFQNNLTGSTFNNNAPNRLYVNGTPVYCSQANANPTTHIEDCTTGNAPSATISSSLELLTGDPIIPASAYNPSTNDSGITSGLVAPDGIVGVLPSYPGAPQGSTTVMYTEKELSYYIAAETTAKGTFSSTKAATIAGTPGPYISQDLPASGPVTIEMGGTAPSPSTATAIITVSCTGINPTSSTTTFTGCTVPTADNGWTYASNTYVAAPGATTVAPSTLALTGEGSASNVAKLYKNNEDLTVLRVAYTTDGSTFSTAGLANGGMISGENNCSTADPAICSSTSSYDDISNPSTTVSPSDLNGYATNEGTPGGANGTDIGSTPGGDFDEMRWVGSAGSIITNPDGSYGMFLSGAWAADGDSDAFNQIFYSSSTNGEYWSVPTPVISTDYSFSASYNQDNASSPTPIGISAYYEGRAYGPSVVQNPDGTLTMVFAGYRFPKSISSAGTMLGTGSQQWTVGQNDLTMYRNILTTTLTSSTSPAVSTTTTLSPVTSPVVVGQSQTLSATVGSVSPGTGTPTGTVTFSGTGGTLCTATLNESSPDTASCSYAYSGPLSSPDSVSASYGGDSNYASSTSASQSVTVNQDATTTSTPAATNGANPANPAVVGEPVTLTSTVAVTSPGNGTPSGSVSFADSGGTLCTGTFSGASPDTASCTYTYTTPQSGDAVTASYGGDTNDATSTSASLNEVVNVAPTTTSFSIFPSSPVTGQQVTLSATVAANAPSTGTPGGKVAFTDGAGALCTGTLNAGTPDVASCSTTYGGPTTDDITATYQGDGDYASSSASGSVTVGEASTSTSLATSTSTPVVGQPVTYTATVAVTSPGAGTPTGTVAFTGDAGPLCSDAPLSSSSPFNATCTVAYASPGTDDITAAYAGDGNYLGSSSSSSSVTISPDATTTTATAVPDVGVVGQAITLSTDVSVSSPGVGTPSGTVTFTDGSGTLCAGTLSGSSPATATCTYTYTGPTPMDDITATYSGDADDAGSNATTSVTIGQDDTTTTLTTNPNSPVVGEPVTYTATVAVSAPGAGTPTGTVDFSDGSGPLCTGVALNAGSPDTATCPETYGAVTSDQVTATYSGDTDDLGSSDTVSVTVGEDTTTTSVTAAPSSPVVGQSVTLSATVAVSAPGAGTPTGTVTFSGDGASCSGKLNGENPDVATCTRTFSGATAGDVTANYGGDENTSSSSGSTPLTVGQAVTATTVSVTPSNPLVGQTVTLSAAVAVQAPGAGSPTGTVTFSDSGGTLCTATLGQGNPNTASCTTSYPRPITDTITASYGGDTNFSGSSGSGQVTIGRGTSVTAVVSSSNPSVTGQPVTFTATVMAKAPAGGVPTGTVEFGFSRSSITCQGGDGVTLSNGTATCTVSGLTPADSVIYVAATYSGSASFTGSSAVTLNQAVDKADVHVTVNSSVNPVANEKTVTFSTVATAAAPGSGTPTGTFTWRVTNDGGTTITCNPSRSTTICNVPNGKLVAANGPYTAKATYSGDSDFNSGAGSLSETVSRLGSKLSLSDLVLHAGTETSGSVTAHVAGVSAPLGLHPTGTVTFVPTTAGGQTVECTGGNTMTLTDSDSVACHLAKVPNASFPSTVTVNYSGDGNFLATSASKTLTG